MRTDLSLKELIHHHLCGTGSTSRAHEQQLTPQRAASQTGPTLLRILRYRLKHGCFARGDRSESSMKDPRSIPAVSSPDPQTCMCCWYQQLYNPTRPTNPLGLVGYGSLLVVVRLFPPMKPDEVNGMCEQHIDLLYPPKRARATRQSDCAQVAAGAAQAVGVGA